LNLFINYVKIINVKYESQLKTLNVYEIIRNSIKNNKLGQAYLFLCEDNLTNNLLSLCCSKVILCGNHNACESCQNCLLFNANTHPDLLIYPKEKHFVVEDAVDVYNKVQVKPLYSKNKIFLINDIDLSTVQAQNKMLKIIEEPPENVIFILTATNEDKVLQTIKSRCQILRVDKFKKELILTILENENIENLEVAVALGDGYIGKSLEILNNEEFLKNYQNMLYFIKNFKKSDQIPAFYNLFSKDKDGFLENLKILNDFYRDSLICGLGSSDLVKNQNILSDINEVSTDYSVSALNQILKIINNNKKMLDSNVLPNLLLDNFLMDILEVKFLCK